MPLISLEHGLLIPVELIAVKAKLRKVDRYELEREDEMLIVLCDPMGVSEPVAVPKEAAPVLELLDGNRCPAQIRQSLLMRRKIDIPTEDILSLIGDLQLAGFLDDDHFRQQWQRTHHQFMNEDVRAPRFAGILYPEDAHELRHELRFVQPRFAKNSEVIGVVCPYQPFEQVTKVLEPTLCNLPEAASLDLIIILGTDHFPGLLPFTLTHKSYQTPLGCVPVATEVLKSFTHHLPWICNEEIRHLKAHSIEMATVLIHYLYGQACPPILPILCGQTALFTDETAHETNDFLAFLEQITQGLRVLWWTSAELTHAGSAYGQAPIAEDDLKKIHQRDTLCLQNFIEGRPETFMKRCLEPHHRFGRISGAAAMTTLARALPVGYRAILDAYQTLHSPGSEFGAAGLAGIKVYSPNSFLSE